MGLQVLVGGDVVVVCRLLHALGKSLTPHGEGDSDDEDEADMGKGRRRRTRGTTAEAKRSRAEQRGKDTAKGAMATVRAQLLDRQDVRAKVSTPQQLWMGNVEAGVGDAVHWLLSDHTSMGDERRDGLRGLTVLCCVLPGVGGRP